MAEATDGKITKQLLKTRSGEFDIESIHILCLRDAAISDLGCISECSGLESLDLSRNDLSKLHKLAGLTSLTQLNISANRIVSLEGLQTLEKLETLNVSGNLIGRIEELRYLSELEKLTSLRMQDPSQGLSNPVCNHQDYVQQTLNHCPHLLTLDGERVKGRGSEVFAMCRSIDKLLEGPQRNGSATEIPQISSWIPGGFWNNSEQLQHSSLHDAEDQLRELLQGCKLVTKEAEQELKEVESETSRERTVLDM